MRHQWGERAPLIEGHLTTMIRCERCGAVKFRSQRFDVERYRRSL
jgi:hypothetical protein